MPEQNLLQNPSRRRLARGAAAAPVVLASLTAKNALAGGHQCTTTGAQSGPKSRGGEDSDCKDVGYSCDYWKDKYKGDLRKFVSCMGVDYKGKTEQVKTKWQTTTKRRRANSRCTESGFTSATCDHILNGEDHTMYPIQDVDVALAGLCAYLNAEHFGRAYYVSVGDAKGLFQGAIGAYPFIKDGKTWTAQECRTHLALLYQAD